MFLAHDVWQTMEHSMGVTLMFKKPCLLSMDMPSRRSSGSSVLEDPP